MKKPDRKRAAPRRTASALPRRKLISVEPDILQALVLLARDRMQDFDELADEAFRDVLKKHRRPVTLREALKQSARTPAND